MKILTRNGWAAMLMALSATAASAAVPAPEPDVACDYSGLVGRAYGEIGDIGAYPVMFRFQASPRVAAGNEIVTVSRGNGALPITVSCPGPTLLMRLVPGTYMASVETMGGTSRTFDFQVARSGAPQIVNVGP